MERELYTAVRRIEATHWWYVGRRRIVLDWLRRLTPAGRPRILDVGCGTGFNLERLPELLPCEVVGADISADALEFCRSRQLSALVRADAAEPPFLDGSFDVILALDVIEHVRDDARALASLRRLLRPGGCLMIFTPAFQFLWSEHDTVAHHFRRYTGGELGRKLQAAGFAIEKLSYANTLLFPAVWAARFALRAAPDGAAADAESAEPPAWMNRLLAGIFSFESRLLARMNLPFGVSVLAVARRPAS
jgi:SAM-dependent methyltransferase